MAVRDSIVRPCAADRSRVIKPALRKAFAQPTLPRPPHPVPNVRDDHEPPLQGNETAGDIEVIWVGREGICFCNDDWTTQISLIWFTKLNFSRIGFCRLVTRPRANAPPSSLDLDASGIKTPSSVQNVTEGRRGARKRRRPMSKRAGTASGIFRV
ncbi:hypothetical protein [Bradyrhizobium lablabi]|uniref:hypothetical protein n=1 Tax=Bradyrhizobium lablabi TaxID=722472 RepID=UPI0012ABCF1C|nr:hypothetical protein [Bradyrhizobium lablabi]